MIGWIVLSLAILLLGFWAWGEYALREEAGRFYE